MLTTSDQKAAHLATKIDQTEGFRRFGLIGPLAHRREHVRVLETSESCALNALPARLLALLDARS